jgi:hypothetical protein
MPGAGGADADSVIPALRRGPRAVPYLERELWAKKLLYTTKKCLAKGTSAGVQEMPEGIKNFFALRLTE